MDEQIESRSNFNCVSVDSADVKSMHHHLFKNEFDAQLKEPIAKLRKNWQLQVKQEEIDSQLKLYIPTMLGNSALVDADKRLNGFEEIKRFIAGNEKMLLLLGDSGSGKTLFGQWLVNSLWERNIGWIPVYLHLPTLDYKQDFLNRYLLKHLSILEVHLLQSHGKLLLFLDAYDEMTAKDRENSLFRLGKLENWEVRVIISCRTQTFLDYNPNLQDVLFGYAEKLEKKLGRVKRYQDYKDELLHENISEEKTSQVGGSELIYTGRGQSFKQPIITQKVTQRRRRDTVVESREIIQRYHLVKRYIQEFDLKIQVPIYIKLWKESNLSEVNPNLDYYSAIMDKFPGLTGMITNPFILRIAMYALPRLLEKYSNHPEEKCYHLTRLALYNSFTSAWFERQAKKLLDNGEISDAWRLTIEKDFRIFCTQLAMWMWQNKVVKYQPENIEDWARFLPENHLKGDKARSLEVLRRGALLKITEDNSFSFLHFSLLEYFISERLFKSVANQVSITLGLKFNEDLIANNPEVIRHGVDYLQKNRDFELALREIVEESKHEPRIEIAAANAITILVAANKSFTGANLDHMCIPGANISGGNFDGASIKCADMRNTITCGTWFTRTDLSGSCVDDIKTGELPWVELESEIIACYYLAPETRRYAIVTKKSWILYDSDTHECCATHEVALPWLDGIISSAFSIELNTLLLGTIKGNLIYLDIRNGEVFHQWQADNTDAGVLFLAQSHDGKYALSGSNNRFSFALWDLDNYDQAYKLHQDDSLDRNTALAISGRKALLGSDAGAISSWCLGSRGKINSWKGHNKAVDVLLFSQDEETAFSGSKDSTIKHWNILDTEGGECLQTYVGHTADIVALVCSHDSQWLYSSSKDNSVRRWEVTSGRCTAIWFEQNDFVSSIALSQDDSVLLTASNKGILKRWNTSANLCHIVGQGHTDSISELRLSDNNGLLVSVAKDGSVKRWDIREGQGQCVSTWKSNGLAAKLIVNSEARWALAGLESGHIIQQELDTRDTLNTYSGHGAGINAILMGPDETSFMSASVDRTIKHWSVDTRTCLATWEGHTDSVTCLVMSPTQPLAISGSRDTTIRYWDIVTNTCLGVLRVHRTPISVLAVSPEGDWLLSGSEDGAIATWSLPRAKFIRVLQGHNAKINALAMSPGARWAISSDATNKVNLWDVVKGSLLGQCCLPCPVTVMKWSSTDPTMLVIGMADGSISFWSLQIGPASSMHLMWRSNPWNMVAKNARLLNAHGFDQNYPSRLIQKKILMQRGMQIQESTKSSTDILQQRQRRMPYSRENPPAYLFDPRFRVQEEHWVVSIVKKKNKDNRHTFILLESVEDGYYRIQRIDFFIELRQHLLAEKNTKPDESDFFGQALIEVADKSLDEIIELRKQYCALSSQITRERGEELMRNIRRDQSKKIAYSLPGSGAIYTFWKIKGADKYHNCFSWCLAQLKEVGVELVDDNWLDGLVMHPGDRLRDNRMNIEDNDDYEHRSGKACSSRN